MTTDSEVTDPPLTSEQIRGRSMGWALLTALGVAPTAPPPTP
ncbi:hypothetical protein ACFPZI_22470 [Streptomyces chlorus]|uniref:Uncharacterized protein n=1 Tax=Streptomyces chlorus TaxID=887452 RepID=A0ABW1E0R6_9ACTN